MSEIKVNSVVNSTGDNDSGLDLATNDQVIIKTANTTAVTVDSSQNASFAGKVTINETSTSNIPLTINGGDRVSSVTSPDILIKNTTDDNVAMPIIRLDRESASPAVDDNLGRLLFTGRNDAGETVEYCRLTGGISDETDGTEDGKFLVQTIFNGSNVQRIKCDNSEVVINDSSLSSDFRVETDGSSTTLFCDASEDSVAINSTILGADAKFTVNGVKDGAFGRTCLRLRDTDTTANSGNTMMVCEFSADGNANTATYIAFRDSGAEIGSINCTGSSSVAFNTSSDYRLKENIKPMSDVWDKIKALKPVNFTWKKAPSDPPHDGFIAHELQEIYPQAVSGEKDGMFKRADGSEEIDPQGVDYGKLSTLLAKGLQEAIAKIETLESEVAKLKG